MLYLKKLSRSDGKDVFEMLKGIEIVENSFTNPTFGMTFKEFQYWLEQQEYWDKGEQLPQGYVPQSIYWLYDDSIPVGIGKIRHRLTEISRINGGNIGYAVSRQFRGKGYGSELLKLLLNEARSLGIREIILTVNKGNDASRKVCLKNGGVLFADNEERWFYRF